MGYAYRIDSSGGNWKTAKLWFDELLGSNCRSVHNKWSILADCLCPCRARLIESGNYELQAFDKDGKWTNDLSRPVGWLYRQRMSTESLGEKPEWTGHSELVAVAKDFDPFSYPIRAQRYARGKKWSGWLLFNGNKPPEAGNSSMLLAYDVALRWPWMIDFFAMPSGISLWLLKGGDFEYSMHQG